MKSILGRKMGMTQVFAQDGTMYPVTVIEVLPNSVLQVKTVETDDYDAIQVGYEDKKENRCNKAELGIFKKANVSPKYEIAELKGDEMMKYEVGQQITIRGPYGNSFPVDTVFAGKNLLFIAGGVGLAPLRSVINYCRHYRDRYGEIDIVYGSRSKDDLLDYKEIIEEWSTDAGVNVYLTIDREQEGWDGHVGFVPTYVKELGFDTNKTAVLCGPPIMIKFTLEGLCQVGFDKKNIYTTLELKMKCGVGKCGRCNVGSKYVCLDGPVFSCADLDELPDEY